MSNRRSRAALATIGLYLLLSPLDVHTQSGANIWEQTGSMSTQRVFHAAVALASGQVLVTGGHRDEVSDDDPLASAELYDPLTGTWAPISDMISPRVKHQATLLVSGKVLVTGGCPFDGSCEGLASTEIYDPATGTWTYAAWMTQGRRGHTATRLVTGEILVTGGVGFCSPCGVGVPSAEIYDPTTDTWRPAADMNAPRVGHEATLLTSGLVLVTGGCGRDYGDSACGDTGVPTPELYDLAANQWLPAADIERKSWQSATVRLQDGRVLTTGGIPTRTESHHYNPELNAWAATGEMSFRFAQHTATLLNSGQVLTAGGYQALLGLGSFASAYNGAAVYTPATNAFAPVGNMIHGRIRHTATRLSDGSILVVGGHAALLGDASDGPASASAEIFRPGETPLLAVAPLSLQFEVLTVGDTASLAVTLSNPSTLPLTITEVLTNDAAFAADNTCTVIPPGGTCTLEVRFAPTLYAQLDHKFLEIRSNAPSSPTRVELLGSGVINTGDHWSAAPSLRLARRNHQATLLPWGRVLITGGGPSATTAWSAEVFNPASGQSTFAPMMRAPHGNGHTATLLRTGKVLVAGGGTAAVELFDPASGSWSLAAPLAQPRSFHTATLLPWGRVLVAGNGTAELYTPGTNSWEPTEPMTVNRAQHAATLLANGKVLVVGNSSVISYQPSAELYDPTTNRWESTPTPVLEVVNPTATLLPDGTVLVVSDEGAQIYNPATGGWTATARPILVRNLHSAVRLASGLVLVVSTEGPCGIPGEVPGSCAYQPSAELFDWRTGTWTRTADPLVPRYGHAATLLLDGRVLLSGGSIYAGTVMPLSYMELFTP